MGPEGEMTWDGRMLDLKPGAAWLALKSGAPICATFVRGVFDILPRWAKYPKLRGEIQIKIGKPFSMTAGSERRKMDEVLIRECNQRIVEVLSTLKDET